MWDVFRFAWFAVRTFLGVCGLILAIYAALWMFVKVHSTMAGNSDPDAVRKRVMSYSAQGLPRGDRRAALVSPTDGSECGGARVARCDRH